MSEREEKAGNVIVEAFHMLPDEKKEFLLGYAEGVRAATNPVCEKQTTDDDESEAEPESDA